MINKKQKDFAIKEWNLVDVRTGKVLRKATDRESFIFLFTNHDWFRNNPMTLDPKIFGLSGTDHPDGIRLEEIDETV